LESDRLPLVAIKVYLPTNLKVEEVKLQDLPPNWQDVASYSLLQKIGQDWLSSRRTPILKVPSAIVPVENNCLFNPEHPQFEVEIEPPIKFQFDQRMWKPYLD
jgi:RES domain-containing protein